MSHFFLVKDDIGRDRLLMLDEETRGLYMDGKRIRITGQEFSLLKELCSHADEPVSREAILRNAWGIRAMGVTRTVDVHVQRLRKKLGRAAIQTVYRYGYKLCAEAV